MPTKLILIRHGQTEWSRKKRYCGSLDIGLNAYGKKQAAALCRRVKAEKVQKIYCSHKKRALQTARIVFKGAKIKKIKDFREINFGIFEGLTHKEIIKKYPLIYKKWLRNPSCAGIPEGERLADFKKRIIKALRMILSAGRNKTIAIVTHGGPISIIVNYVLKTKKFWQRIPRAASLTIIERRDEKLRIETFSDTKHLSLV